MVDLIGDYGQSKKQAKTKMWMRIIIVLLILLLLTSIGLFALIYYMQATEFKITIDKVAKADLKNVLRVEGNQVYVPIRDFASYVGYSSYSGDYKQYEEDMTKCYVQNANEIASFTLNSNKIYKTDGNNNYEYFEIDEPVKMMDGKLYTTKQGAQIAFNIALSNQKNGIAIYTLPYLVKSYSSQYANAAITEEKENFANQKAILYDMLIVKNADKHYGVNHLDGREIIGTKYTSIEFIESAKEFIVTTDENKMGIMSYDATTKIGPEYDFIKQVDKNAGLYLVTNNKKQGIVDSNGNVVLYLEYDQIGIDSAKYITNNIKNQYLLYDTCIPAMREKAWGLYDKNGQPIVQAKYKELGCSVQNAKTNGQTVNSVLLIPDFEAIVVKEGDMYGIINAKGEELVPSVLTAVYSATSNGKETYYMIYQGQTINVINYLDQYLQKKTEQTQNSQVQNSTANTETNTTNNQVQNGSTQTTNTVQSNTQTNETSNNNNTVTNKSTENNISNTNQN